MSNPYCSCAARTGSSGCTCSGDGSLPAVGVDSGSLSSGSGVWSRAVTNGETAGSLDRGVSSVSTVRVGAEVDALDTLSSSARSAYRL
jgi:hypothetical protein